MSETRPFRLRVLDAITDAIKQVTIDNGYQHDLTDGVFRGRSLFGDDDPLPLVSILEDPQQSAADPSADRSHNAVEWRLIVQGFALDDFDNPTDPAHILMADVKKALITARDEDQFSILGFNGKVYDLQIGPGIVRPPDDISAKAYFWLTLVVHLVEDLRNPYA